MKKVDVYRALLKDHLLLLKKVKNSRKLVYTMVLGQNNVHVQDIKIDFKLKTMSKKPCFKGGETWKWQNYTAPKKSSISFMPTFLHFPHSQKEGLTIIQSMHPLITFVSATSKCLHANHFWTFMHTQIHIYVHESCSKACSTDLTLK